MDINEIFKRIDELFDENRAKEAERFMIDCLKEAEEKSNASLCLQLLNELIGYYRQTSEADRLKDVIGKTLSLTERMDIQGSVPYGTTVLNVANAYRAMGDWEHSLQYYHITKEIYDRNLPENDMRMAGLYNNLSLLYQELQDYEKAEGCLIRALDIVKQQNAGFETAVTYANLANTCVLAGDYEKAGSYARTAIECFRERQLFDAHYCAALSALGMCHYQKKEFEEAEKLFAEGMEIIENSLGRNLQYERLKANRDACRKEIAAQENRLKRADEMQNKMNDAEVERMTGMKLCKSYYEAYGKQMIQEHFPEYAGKIAVGLAGEGSDCMGYDDEISRDHDWGPDFCLWVTEETYEQIGEQLAKEYDRLPAEFMGYQRTRSRQGQNRRGVMTISGFYRKLVGADRYEDIDWKDIEDYALAAAVNGEVFRDDEGIFTEFRNKLLQGYPEEIRFLKLAEDAARVTQTGQYNYFRMLQRGDLLTADRMLSDCIGNAMRLQHHICNVYPPHDKWLYQSTLCLKNGEALLEILSALHCCMNKQREGLLEQVKALTEKLGDFFAREMYANSDISDIENYLDAHTEELLEKSRFAALSDGELADAVVKTEFEAFDKVKNEGGRAYCQNDWPTFSVMRKSQYMTWNRTMLMQYLYDFRREYERGHNLITEKYGRMMESTAPERYAEIKDNFPELSEEKKAVIEQIVGIQMRMMEEFAEEYPNVAHNARSLHTYEDNPADTSYETYLRGEISTYSDKMLQLYGRYVVRCASEKLNIARQIIENTAKLYGYNNIEEFEQCAMPE